MCAAASMPVAFRRTPRPCACGHVRAGERQCRRTASAASRDESANEERRWRHMPSSTLLAAPSHAPCPVRAGAAPEVGPGKRMRRQILLKPAAPPTPPWSAGNYPSDTTFANPFTRHLAPSHYLYNPRLNTSHLCAQACAQESGRRARRNQGWHKQEAGSRTQDARLAHQRHARQDGTRKVAPSHARPRATKHWHCQGKTCL